MTYNHMFTIAFTVVTPNNGENVTADELRKGLHNRLLNLAAGDEIIEACGLPHDTYIEDEGESMKIKVSDATNLQLDWMVGKIDQPQWTDEDLRWNTYDYCDTGDQDDEPYCPTTNWAQGGPIIERECIAFASYDAASSVPKNPEYWEATLYCEDGFTLQRGLTPLIAAMRCFVASKLGDEVEIPEELI